MIGHHCGKLFFRLLCTAVAATGVVLELSSAQPGPPKATLEVLGNIVPAQPAQVTAQVAGQVMKLHVEPGTTVKKGDVLAELDPIPYKIAVEHAQAKRQVALARLAEAKALLKDALELQKAGVGTSKTAVAKFQAGVDAQEAEVKVAETKLLAAENDLANTKVCAPIDGTILSKSALVGAFADPKSAKGALLYEVADLHKLEAAVNIPEQDIGKVSVGQPCHVRKPGAKSIFKGKVVRVGPVVNKSTATFPIWVSVELMDDGAKLYPGSFVTVQFLSMK
jgi:RND family efflux transporter MFP subunit